jgi:hypothetical protein
MLRIFARWWAKRKYILSQELEAATQDLNANLALKLAGEKRALIEKLNKDADEIDANIKSIDEKLDRGFWECENGHEMDTQPKTGILAEKFNGIDVTGPTCACGAPAKYIKRDQMTGQEKYESDKERKEAEKIAADKRAQAASEETNLTESERTAKYFRGLAANARTIAERIRDL